MKINERTKIEEEVISKFAEGDIQAFDLLYFTFCNRLHNFVFSLIKGKYLAGFEKQKNLELLTSNELHSFY
jgi:hypothetical protein